MFNLKFEIQVTIENIPIQWIPKIEIYYPDLPQFPIMYIHTFCDEQRLIGCPVYYSVNNCNSGKCDITFTVLSNLEPNDTVNSLLKTEIENRIGFSDRIDLNIVKSCCNGNASYESLFSDLWNYIELSYGSYVPYGRFFEEVYSIVRFVSAWTPKTGRQSEMRMLYNFMSAYGESVTFPKEWKHLEYYIIPCYKDALNEDYSDFPTFSVLYSGMKKTFESTFTGSETIEGVTFKVLPSAWPQNKDEFINIISKPLHLNGVLTEEERYDVEELVDAFNRHPWRAAFFISAYLNITNSDYQTWNKDFFKKVYANGGKLKGYSEKVIACFLQQGFLNDEVIPIDTWIETFYNYPLGIKDKVEFYDSFNMLGKLERIIWLASQSNKTNMRDFFDILWCQRYGVIGNSVLRGINPIACYSCKLKNTCVGIKKCENQNVSLVTTPIDLDAINNGLSPIPTSADYICWFENKVPKKAYKKERKKHSDNWVLVDEFSGYSLDSTDAFPDAILNKGMVSMREFINAK